MAARLERIGFPAQLLVAALFLWGGATAGIYTVGLAHLASRFSGADLAGANAAFVFCYALGMLVGPLAIGDAMARAPIAGAYRSLLGVVFCAYTIIVALRIALTGRNYKVEKPAALLGDGRYLETDTL